MQDARKAREKLDKLIEHGKRTAWNPVHDVEWDLGERQFSKLAGEQRAALRTVLSLVYYSDAQGREILETLCRSLSKKREIGAAGFPLSEKVREFFEQQMEDEERHASGIRLLFDRLGLEPEPKALSHLFYSKFLLADGFFDAKLVMIYWYIEVLAKGIFVELKKRFPGTCVDSLFSRIIKDEARHVGFGEIYLPLHAKTTGTLNAGQMALAYYSSAAVLPGLYRFGHYSGAGRILGLDLKAMFAEGMGEIGAKARRMPEGCGILDMKKPADWLAVFL